MYDEEGERRYKRAVLETFNATEVEPMEVIHSGKDDKSFLLRLALWTKESFRAIFARKKEETAGMARKRKKEKDRAIREAGERIEERYVRAQRLSPGKKISRLVSTSDLEINTLLAEPSRVGQKKGFAHTGYLDANRKVIEKIRAKARKAEEKALRSALTHKQRRLERQVGRLERLFKRAKGDAGVE